MLLNLARLAASQLKCNLGYSHRARETWRADRCVNQGFFNFDIMGRQISIVVTLFRLFLLFQEVNVHQSKGISDTSYILAEIGGRGGGLFFKLHVS